MQTLDEPQCLQIFGAELFILHLCAGARDVERNTHGPASYTCLPRCRFSGLT